MNKYLFAGIAALSFVFLTYFIQFGFLLGFEFSEKQDDWAQFGDFIGGTLNPMLSFISILLLIKSLRFQFEANRSLTNELNEGKKTEKFRRYETFFFNMLNNQKSSFGAFFVYDMVNYVNPIKLYGSAAVMFVEDNIQALRDRNIDDKDIIEFVRLEDGDDKFFNEVRIFSVIVKCIDERLSDENGFNSEIRKEQYHTLINFTDYANLRLINLCMQFFDYHAAQYVKNHIELNSVFSELGLKVSPY
jgi:hypothetical protein